MQRLKLVRITTVPVSLEKLLEGQLRFMSQYYEVCAISSEQERLRDYGEKEGVMTHYVPLTRKITPLRDLAAVWKLYRFCRTYKPAIVHSHTPKAGIVGMLAARLAGVPLRMHTVAGLPLMEASGLKKRILLAVEKLTYRCAHKVYPNSLGLKDYILSEGLTTTDKLSVLGEGSSNGIDTDYFDPKNYSEEHSSSTRKQLGIPESDFVFVFVGRMVKDKGINELVAAFQQLYQENKAISLLLVGPFEPELDPVSTETGEAIQSHPKIVTTGYQTDIRSFLSSSDVLVFPSYREGFPNVVMQAGAMGLPSIVTDINGCNEIITHGVNGLIIPPKNASVLRDTMLEIVENPELRRSLAGESRQRIVARYDRKRMWELILEEYRKVQSGL